MTTCGRGNARWRAWLAALALLAATGGRVTAQSLSVRAEGQTLRVSVRGLRLIDGDALAGLKDGRSIRVDIDLSALDRPDGLVLAARRERFVLSYDLWEERFAVTRIATPPRSVSHLTRENAETWCVEQLQLPVSALAAHGRDAPFWIRLAYRAIDRDPAAESGDDSEFTLRRLIDAFSRRPESPDRHGTLAAGPFRLSALVRQE